jgi:hypothetical protein
MNASGPAEAYSTELWRQTLGDYRARDLKGLDAIHEAGAS